MNILRLPLGPRMGQTVAIPTTPVIPAGPIVTGTPTGPTDYIMPLVIGAVVLGGVALLISASKK